MSKSFLLSRKSQMRSSIPLIAFLLILSCSLSAQESPVKVRLKNPEGDAPAGAEVDVVDVNTTNLSLFLTFNGKPLNVKTIDYDDYIACLEAFGDAKNDPRVFYGLVDYCVRVHELKQAKQFALHMSVAELDSTFHGDADKRAGELCNPALRYRETLLKSDYYDSAETPPASGPRAKLLELAKHPSASGTSELRKVYLQLQEARLFGEAKLPSPPVRTHLTPLEWLIVRGKTEGENPIEKLSDDDAKSMKAWFAENPAFRDMFLLALEPGVDFYQNAARVALRIKAANPKDIAGYDALVVAFATTWDDPSIVKPLDVGIPELYEHPAPVCRPEEAFAWYIKNRASLCPWFQQTPWRLLAYVAADTASLAERDWVLKNYKFNVTLGKSYAEIQYDNAKLQDRIGKLAGRPYTLENLKSYGGVCRDQAFYARSVCRYFGLPAYWASGMGKTGGIGHAWVGWVAKTASGYQLSDFGRYADDKFFTATVTHPRTGEVMLDYILNIESHGLSDEKSYDEADLLFHVFEDVGSFIDPKMRYELLIKAVRTNAFHRGAWLAIADGTAEGNIPQNTASAQWQYLTERFKDAPDFTMEVLDRFVHMFKDVESGYAMLDTTVKMYIGIKREDLAAQVRTEQLELCVNGNRKDIAFTTAIKGMNECANTGKEGAELAHKAVELAQDPAQKKQVMDGLKGILARTPKKRVDEPNEFWLDLGRLLRDMYKAQKDEAAATKLDGELKALDPSGTH